MVKTMMDKRGQTNVLASSIAAIVGIIGILVFVKVYDAIPTDNISAGAQSLLNIVDLVLAAAIIISIVLGVLFIMR